MFGLLSLLGYKGLLARSLLRFDLVLNCQCSKVYFLSLYLLVDDRDLLVLYKFEGLGQARQLVKDVVYTISHVCLLLLGHELHDSLCQKVLVLEFDFFGQGLEAGFLDALLMNFFLG